MPRCLFDFVSDVDRWPPIVDTIWSVVGIPLFWFVSKFNVTPKLVASKLIGKSLSVVFCKGIFCVRWSSFWCYCFWHCWETRLWERWRRSKFSNIYTEYRGIKNVWFLDFWILHEAIVQFASESLLNRFCWIYVQIRAFNELKDQTAFEWHIIWSCFAQRPYEDGPKMIVYLTQKEFLIPMNSTLVNYLIEFLKPFTQLQVLYNVASNGIKISFELHSKWHKEFFRKMTSRNIIAQFFYITYYTPFTANLSSIIPQGTP